MPPRRRRPPYAWRMIESTSSSFWPTVGGLCALGLLGRWLGWW